MTDDEKHASIVLVCVLILVFLLGMFVGNPLGRVIIKLQMTHSYGNGFSDGYIACLKDGGHAWCGPGDVSHE